MPFGEKGVAELLLDHACIDIVTHGHMTVMLEHSIYIAWL